MRRSGHLTLAACLLLAAPLVYGAEARQSGGDAQRLQFMLQQLNQEKTALAAENAKLKAEVRDLESEVEKLTKDNDANKRKLRETSQNLANSSARNDSLQGAFDTLRERFDELVTQFRALAANLRDVESNRDELIDLSEDYQSRVAMCEGNNDALYQATLELTDSYEKKGFFAVFGQKEPLTGLKRVEIENRMDEYRQLAEDMRLRYEVIDEDPTAERRKSDAPGS